MGCQCAKKDQDDESEILKGTNKEVKSIPHKNPDSQNTFNSNLHTNIHSGIISPTQNDLLLASKIQYNPNDIPNQQQHNDSTNNNNVSNKQQQQQQQQQPALYENEALLQPKLPQSIREDNNFNNNNNNDDKLNCPFLNEQQQQPQLQIKEPAPRTDNSFANQSVNKVSETESKQRKKIEYNNEVFTLINKIRQDPPSFAQDIEDAISKITTIDGKLIYKGAVKVSIKTGESVFKDAANKLRQMEPLEPFELCEDIAIVVPDEEDKMKNTKVLQELVEEKRKEVDIDSYFKDLIKDPYTSVLLMVIDDNGKNTGKKRDVVLGKEFTKMAVTSRRVKKTFCAYLTFAK